MVRIEDFRSNLRLYIPYHISNKLPLIGISLGLALVLTLLFYAMYKIYIKNRDRFKVSIETNRFILEQKDSIAKWVEGTEKRIKKNNIRIKAKRYIFVSVSSCVAALVFGLYVFKNTTAAVLFSIIFLVIPEYIISLHEDNLKKKIEDELVAAIRLYTAEFMQKKPMQKIFSLLATKINDPLGRYFSDAYYEMITGVPVDNVLSKLSSRFNSHYGKMFIQLIHQSINDSNIVELFPDIITKIENNTELSRENKTNLSTDRLMAFIMAMLPIPIYFAMARFFPETIIFVTETYYGRLIITLAFLSILIFLILDKSLRRVD